VAAAQRVFAPKSSPNAAELQNSLLNSLIAGKSHGDRRDQHCVASQVLPRSGDPLPNREKGPPMAGFDAPAISLYVPDRRFGRAKSRKISAGRREYSRFRETTARDLVRSPLPPDQHSPKELIRLSVLHRTGLRRKRARAATDCADP
jgi:hypothetical protein